MGKKDAATKERIQTVKDAETARDKAKTAKSLKEANAASTAAFAALKKQAEELGNVTDWVTFYKKQEKMRKTKKCGIMWKDCKNQLLQPWLQVPLAKQILRKLHGYFRFQEFLRK